MWREMLQLDRGTHSTKGGKKEKKKKWIERRLVPQWSLLSPFSSSFFECARTLRGKYRGSLFLSMNERNQGREKKERRMGRESNFASISFWVFFFFFFAIYYYYVSSMYTNTPISRTVSLRSIDIEQLRRKTATG